jgi:plastocyanin
MTRRLRALAGASILAMATLAALAAAPAAFAGDPCFHGYSIPPSTTEATSAVRMEPCAFVPTNIRVATGAIVTFTNASGEAHLLTGANQAWGDREEQVLPGKTVSVTFDEAGVYAFSCAIHRGMSGAVIVGDGGLAAAAGAAGAAGAAPVSSTGSGTDNGLLASLAVVGLAGLATLGWAVAFVQRRARRVGAAAPSSPAELAAWRTTR